MKASIIAVLLLASIAQTPTSGVTVSGRVVGLEVTQGAVIVITGTQFESPIAPNGSFQFRNVPPGTYTTRLIYSGPVPTSASFRVGGTDVTGLVTTVPQDRLVTAWVIVEGGNGRPGVSIGAQAKNAAGQIFTSASPVPWDGTNNGQFFTFKLPDGEYTLTFNAIPSGLKLKSVSYGSVDLQREPLKVNGSLPWSIIVRLSPA